MTIAELFIKATNMALNKGKLQNIDCSLLVSNNDDVTSAVIKAIVEKDRTNNTYFVTYCNGKLKISEPMWGVKCGNA